MTKVRTYVSCALLVFGAWGCSTSAGDAVDTTTLASHADPTAACETACDCDPGFACQNAKCVESTPAVYCCGATTCPAERACQDRAGATSTCGTAPAPFDLGLSSSGPTDLSTGGISIPGLPDLSGVLGGGGTDAGSTFGALCSIIPCTTASDCQPFCNACSVLGTCQ